MSKRVFARRGFTLVEILLVIVLIGLLAGVAVVALTGTQKKAKVDVTRLKMEKLQRQINTYQMHVGHYPTTEEGGLNALVTLPSFENEAMTEKWGGPYIEKSDELLDAWNNPFSYEPVDSADATEGQPSYKIWSNGPDGSENTEDDIRNWQDETT